ncbi:MAG TPA: hypothetical protein ENJ87_03050 [Gammaproteobacteria bacterium]|nr:hypothetical protein [Gammaproteobacteria bacterium]
MTTVLLCQDIAPKNLQTLLERYGMEIREVIENDAIPGSFWQPPEAGLIGNVLYIRNDTPVHSALHESCHYICMDKFRREKLDTDAGGDYEEEDGVCYLQVLLSDFIPEMGQKRMFSDMDTWGYSFRLGSAKTWFEKDAEDAREWLLKNRVITSQQKPTWNVRE